MLRAHGERLLEVGLGLALLVLRELHLGDVRIERGLRRRVRLIDEEERLLVVVERSVPITQRARLRSKLEDRLDGRHRRK